MELLLEIVKYTLPALIVFFTAYFLLKTLLDSDQQRRRHELNVSNQKITTPLRLKAYERLVLYLERISPNSILPRTLKAEMTASQLQKLLIRTIREEFEHNLSQQVYISTKAWNATVSAKENMTKMVNMIAARVLADGKNKSGAEFAKTMLEAIMDMKENPTSVAIDIVKGEAKELFG